MVEPIRPVDALPEQLRSGFGQAALMLQSAGSGVTQVYAEAAIGSTRSLREAVDELDDCVQTMLAARHPVGLASCYATFLSRLAQRSAVQALALGGTLWRAGAAIATAQPDGSRPPVADSAP